MGPVLNWSHGGHEAAEQPLRVRRIASAEERAALAQALDIPDCKSVAVDYEIRSLAGERYLVRGSIDALLTQNCVVTLEPVEQRLQEEFEVEFWPPEQLDPGRQQEIDVVDGPDIEALEAGRIPVGRLIYEQIAAGLDPYPRKAGASFDWAGEPPQTVNPFSVLKKLKQVP